MTLKKHFVLLTSTIITLPVICFLFVLVFIYTNSPKRILTGTYKNEIDNIITSLTEREYKDMERIIKELPAALEFIIFTDESKILFSKFEEFNEKDTFNLEDFEKQLADNLKYYIYQVSEKSTQKGKVYLITRVRRGRYLLNSKKFYIPFTITALLIFITICCILIFITGNIIFNSILTIKKQTSELAEGNLSKPFTIKNKSLKENEITEISKSLETMRKSLLEAQNQKNKFIMGISHDLRTPVSIIRGYTEAIQDKILTNEDELTKANNLILNKTSQLENMIDNLIDFMKMNYNEIKNKMELHSITNTINQFLKEVQFMGSVFKREIKTKSELEKKEIYIHFDKQMIIRLFENLANNALRYTNEGDEISFYARQTKKEILFSVKDSGIGIAEKDLKNIFDIFYRGTNSRREEGLGLGLSIVKNILEIHDWDIKVESEINKGTCFTVIIPIN